MDELLSCPDAESLEQFVLGRMAGPEADRLEEHLRRCSRCGDLLQTLKAEDAFVEEMREQVDLAPLPASDLVSDLIQHLCRLPALRGEAPTTAEAGAASETTQEPAQPTQELYDFLAPARGPGEMGWLGPYRVLKVLGVGGMGVVFHAEDPQLQRHVALKTMKPALAANASARQRFQREAQATAALSHDHIVTIHQVGEDRGVPFLAMQLLHGEALDDRMKREGKLPVAEVLRIGREIALGLAAAHERGLIHRDVKPSNIWLEAERGRVKIVDFGLARATAGEAAEASAHSLPPQVGAGSLLTQTGTIMGTPAYISPEQARGLAVDGRGDLFSLGCVLYRLCTGEVPFKGADTLETLRAVERHQPPPVHSLNPAVPRALSDLVIRLLAKRPEERYPSARAVAAALECIQVQAPKLRPRRWRLAALLAGLLVALGVGAYYAVEYLTPPPEPVEPEGPPLVMFGPAVHIYHPGLQPIGVASGDFNGDGKLDLVVTNYRSLTVSVLLGNGDGTFQTPSVVPDGYDEDAYSCVAVADVNGDGKLDILLLSDNGTTVRVMLGNGDGTFQAALHSDIGSMAGFLAVADFNGDGKLDLVVTHPYTSTRLLLGKGDGTFQAPRNLFTAAPPGAVAAGDFDGDGKADIVVADLGLAQVSVLRGNGDGTFQAPVAYSVGEDSSSTLVVSDLNGDGKPDLVVGHARGAFVSVLLGNGDGTFQKAVRYDTASLSGLVVVGDFNGDGKLDLAVAQESSCTVSVLLGKGDGTFGKPVSFATSALPRSEVVGDFNGDGRLDLVTVSGQSKAISVLLNRPPAPHFMLSSSTTVLPGSPVEITVTARTADFRTDTRFSGTVHFTCDDPRAELPVDFTFVPGDQGVHTFPVTLKRGRRGSTVTVTDTADRLVPGNWNLRVQSLATTHLGVEAPPTAAVGEAWRVTIRALDRFDNIAVNFTATIHFTCTDPKATLPNDYTFLPADDSWHRFTKEVILRTPGKQTVTVTATTDPKLTVSTTVTVK